MRTFALVAAAAFASSAFAAPTAEPKNAVPCREGVERPGCVGTPLPEPKRKCMNRKQAVGVASTFQSLIQGYTIEQALAALTEDFVDYSSAVSIVINKGASEPNDITQPIFTSREQFMMGHGKQKPIPFETLDVWHNCKGTVSMRWLTTRSAMDQPTEAAAIVGLSTTIMSPPLLTSFSLFPASSSSRLSHPTKVRHFETLSLS